MNKADELLREYFDALDATEDPTIVGSTCALIRAESACRDYLNEKPHDLGIKRTMTGDWVPRKLPPTYCTSCGFKASYCQCADPASPPHAAAEPDRGSRADIEQSSERLREQAEKVAAIYRAAAEPPCALCGGSGQVNSRDPNQGAVPCPQCAAEPEKPVALLPCPFCGFTPHADDDDCIYPATRTRTVWNINCYETGGGCSASILGSSPEDCIEKWNRRASPSAQPSEMDILASLDWTRLLSGDRRALDPAHQPIFDRLNAQPIAREPTEAMIQAAKDGDYHLPVREYIDIWRAMYDAAVKR